MKVYNCIIEDKTTNNMSREIIPAKNKKALMDEWGGNGEFIQIKDETSEWPINTDCVIETLRNAGFGLAEQRIIRAILEASPENIMK